MRLPLRPLAFYLAVTLAATAATAQENPPAASPPEEATTSAAGAEVPPSVDNLPQRVHVQLNLPQCIDRVLSQSVEMDMVKASVAVSEGQRSQASRARWLPHVELTDIFSGVPEAHCRPIDASGATLPSSGDFQEAMASCQTIGKNFITGLTPYNRVELSLVQPLYTFGKLDAAMALANAGLAVKQGGVKQKQAEIVNRVRLLYWGLLLARDIDAILYDVRKNLDDAYNSTKDKLDAGSAQVTNVDLYKLEVFRAQVAAKSEDLVKERSLSQRTMNLLLGLEPAQDFQPVEDHLESPAAELKSLDFYQESASRNRPEMLQVRAGLEARLAQVGLARANLYPDIFFGGGFSYSKAPNRRMGILLPPGQYFKQNPLLVSGDPFNTARPVPAAFLGLRWDLSLHRKDAELETAKAELLETQAQARAAEFGFRIKVEQAYLEVVRARNAHDSLDRALSAARKWFRSATLNYSIGVTDTDELIKAYQSYVQLRGEYFKALFEYNQAFAALHLEAAVTEIPQAQEPTP